jgi:predicted nucleic acid-binding protein
MIAAAAASRGAQLATRNTRDFTDCGIELIDPWVDAPI